LPVALTCMRVGLWGGATAAPCGQTLYGRQLERSDALIHQSEQLTKAGIEPSVGSRGDDYDNALAETINGLYKAELIHRRAPRKTKESLEIAKLESVSWFNHQNGVT
jgi:putative transposase